MTVPLQRAASWLGRHRRRLIMSMQVLVLVLVARFLVVPQLRGSAGSLHLLFRFGSGWILLALAAEMASLACYTVVTRVMLPRRTRPPLRRVMGIDMSAIALGHCLPDGGAAGTALSWRLLIAEGVPAAEAAFAKVAQGLGSAIVLQALLLTGYLIGFATTGFSRWAVLPMVAAVTILLFAVLITNGARSPGLRRRIARSIRLLPWCGSWLAAGMARIYRRHLVEQLRSAFVERETLLIAVAAAAANWSFDAVALWASIRACGVGIGLEGLAVAFGIQALAAWLPVTPSGLGISEAVMIPALVAFDGHHDAIVLGVLTWRVIAYWLPIPIGAVAFTLLRTSRRKVAARIESADGAQAPTSTVGIAFAEASVVRPRTESTGRVSSGSTFR